MHLIVVIFVIFLSYKSNKNIQYKPLCPDLLWADTVLKLRSGVKVHHSWVILVR